MATNHGGDDNVCEEAEARALQSTIEAWEEAQFHLDRAQEKLQLETKIIINNKVILEKHFKDDNILKATAEGIRETLQKLRESRGMMTQMQVMRERLRQSPVEGDDRIRAWTEMRNRITAKHTVLEGFVKVLKDGQNQQKYIVFVELVKENMRVRGDQIELQKMVADGFPFELHRMAAKNMAEEKQRVRNGMVDIVTQELADTFERMCYRRVAVLAREVWTRIAIKKDGYRGRGE